MGVALERRREGQGGRIQRNRNGHTPIGPEGVLESYRDTANATLKGGCIPDSWKLEIIFPIEKVEGTEKVEKHRPTMLTDACRKAYTVILIKKVRKVWDTNKAISSCNSGFARGSRRLSRS